MKKKINKKYFIIGGCILELIIVLLIVRTIFYHKTYEYKFGKLGYSSNEINEFRNKLTETSRDYLLSLEYNKNIINLVLGGNHDKDSVIGGIDAIKVLSSERTDFIYLGYTHAKVTFNGHVSALNSLGIHHPNIRYPNPVGDFSYSTEKLQSTINSMFAVNGEAWDTYLDVVGHIHKSGFDALKGICIVPSYTRDRVMDGAWHLKIYFDEKGNIMNMVLMPLVKKGGLVKITEMFYDKKLTKSI